MSSSGEILLTDLFAELEKEFGAEIVGNVSRTPIADVTSDSREAGAGKIFVAIKGICADGHRYIAEAIERGVEAVVVQREEPIPQISMPMAVVPDTREALVILLREMVDEIPDKLFAVTGTNGKTTIAHILWHIFTAAGQRAGVIGTLGFAFEDGKHQKLPITTPGAEQLWRLLAQMRKRGISEVALEASSHGLHQKRVWGLKFDVAIFTNLTQDHLDYHGDMESYLAAKCALFCELPEASLALVNIDDPSSEQVIAANRGQLITYALKNKAADIIAEPISMDISGSRFILRTQEEEFEMHTQLPGKFNIYNVAAAAGAAIACGYEPDTVIRAIAGFAGIRGRFQRLDMGQSFAVVIDYAHTPDALQNLIIATREITRGRIIVLFGAGGDRDHSKRPIMGRIAAEYADVVIITSDNPRTEDPLKIIEMIEEGIPDDSEYVRIPDRREAIFEAVRIARNDDIVLIAGKGHEDYQIIGEDIIHFDDTEVAEEAIRCSL